MSGDPLKLRAVGHAYSGAAVFAEFSLTVAAGELVSVLGASGSGKSTLLRAAAGFVTPTQGSVWLSGAEVARDGLELVAAERRGVGMMFQDYALFPHMTVSENVAFGLSGGAGAQARVTELLALVGLDGLGTRRPGQLSGGQQQRVALARALAPRPSLLLLDEPFANLDGPLRFEVGRQVVDILSREGVGALLVTHDREEALGLSHRVAVLGRNGPGPATLLQVGNPESVYTDPINAEVAMLTGRGSLLVHDSQMQAVVRPEDASFTRQSDGDAEVLARRYAGGFWELHVETPAGVLLIDHRRGAPPEVGDRGKAIFSNKKLVPIAVD